MGILFQILGYGGLALVLVIMPNVRDLRQGTQDYVLLGISLLLVGVGLLARRLARLEELLRGPGQKPT